MSWQAQIYERLHDREWHKLGDLFEAVEARIPLHHAMRHAMQATFRRVEFPPNSEARWRLFLSTISTIGIESDGNPRRRLYTDQVRLHYVAGHTCEHCDGPVIRASWSSPKSVVCLACATPTAVPVPVPTPIPEVIAPVVVRPSPGWQWRARRALAEFVRTARLPFLTVSQIVKGWDRERSRQLDHYLLSRGKKPLTQQEFNHWLAEYIRRNPP
jgi:hypothetical protein